jgi:hypothetical protein
LIMNHVAIASLKYDSSAYEVCTSLPLLAYLKLVRYYYHMVHRALEECCTDCSEMGTENSAISAIIGISSRSGRHFLARRPFRQLKIVPPTTPRPEEISATYISQRTMYNNNNILMYIASARLNVLKPEMALLVLTD